MTNKNSPAHSSQHARNCRNPQSALSTSTKYWLSIWIQIDSNRWGPAPPLHVRSSFIQGGRDLHVLQKLRRHREVWVTLMYTAGCIYVSYWKNAIRRLKWDANLLRSMDYFSHTNKKRYFCFGLLCPLAPDRCLADTSASCRRSCNPRKTGTFEVWSQRHKQVMIGMQERCGYVLIYFKILTRILIWNKRSPPSCHLGSPFQSAWVTWWLQNDLPLHLIDIVLYKNLQC